MQPNTRTDELLRQLSTSVLPVEDAEHAAARRARVIAHLASMVKVVPLARKRRRFARVAGLCAAAAIVLGVGISAMRRHPSMQAEQPRASNAVLALQGSVQVIHHAGEVVAPPLERVPVGNTDEVVTGAGAHARAWLASGAEVDIGPQSRLRLNGQSADLESGAAMPKNGNEAIVLGAGRVTVRVPKLGPARTLAVETPEAVVVVHGTVFSVERTAISASTARTVIDVTSGRVAVRGRGGEVLLSAGDHWSSESSAPTIDPFPTFEPPTGASAAEPDKPKAHPSVQRGAGGSSKGSAEVSPEKSSSLAAENRLLQAAMAARQQGDARRAVQLAGELIARFPTSPLVEEARVERMRALFGSGAAAAAADARAYLSDYPQGFARQEANRILAGTPR